MDFVLKSNLRIFFRNCFTDFFSKEFSRIFAQRFFRGFSLEYSFADFLLNVLSRIFIQIWLCGTIKNHMRWFFLRNFLSRASLKAIKALIPFSIFHQRRFSLKSSWIFFEYSFSDFLLNFLSLNFFRIFFRGFSFEYS